MTVSAIRTWSGTRAGRIISRRFSVHWRPSDERMQAGLAFWEINDEEIPRGGGIGADAGRRGGPDPSGIENAVTTSRSGSARTKADYKHEADRDGSGPLRRAGDCGRSRTGFCRRSEKESN